MALRVQLELQDREASWDFLVREESVACLDFQDLVVHQESREQRVRLETKDPPDRWVSQGPTDLVVIPVLMGLLDLTAHQARMVFWDKGGTEETSVPRDFSELRGFLVPQVPWGLPAGQEGEEMLALEDP